MRSSESLNLIDASKSGGAVTGGSDSQNGGQLRTPRPNSVIDLLLDQVEAGPAKAPMAYWHQFKRFVIQTRVLETGVGVIVGRAFQEVVRSFVNDLFVPPIAAIAGDRVSNKFLVLRQGRTKGKKFKTVEEAFADGAITLNYGRFVHQSINFLAVGLSVYWFLRVLKNFFEWRADPHDRRPCPKCLSDIPKKAERCAFCGSDIPVSNRDAVALITNIGIAAVGGVGIAAFIWSLVHPRHDDRSKIPGPKGHWLVGVLPDLIKHSTANNINEWFTGIHEVYGKIAYAWSPVSEFLLIADPALVAKYNADSETFPRGTVFMDVADTDPRWKPHRRILSQGFTPLHLRYGFEVTMKVIDKLLDKWDDGRDKDGVARVELRESMINVTLDVIGHMLFSKDFSETRRDGQEDGLVQTLREMTDTVLKRSGIPRWLWGVAGVGLGKSREYTGKVFAVMDGFIEEKKERRRSGEKGGERRDVTDILLDAVGEGIVEEKDMRGELLGLLFAGHDTTAHAITAAVYHLCANPDEANLLLDEIESIIGLDGSPTYENLKDFKYLDAYLKETLRLHPATVNLPRVASRNVLVEGYKIPKGTPVFLDQTWPMKAEEYWGEDAKVFRPGRWVQEGFRNVEGAYLPFGGGGMVCLGMKLAYIEAKSHVADVTEA
ncbi:heme binding [Dinochytrium kinnereticum]|nr:heme binding [Dinochytrium kinnereticum]